MERLNIDSICPFPDAHYFLVVVCYFTRRTALFLCAHATTDITAQKLLEHISRYRAPTQILSDRDSHFVTEVMSELLRLVGIEYCLAIAYSKEESTIVERENREVNRYLRTMFFHDRVINDCIKSIPLVQYITNASPNARTRLAPTQLLFGNTIDSSGASLLLLKVLLFHSITIVNDCYALKRSRRTLNASNYSRSDGRRCTLRFSSRL